VLDQREDGCRVVPVVIHSSGAWRTAR
jgi:hypothetical protein